MNMMSGACEAPSIALSRAVSNKSVAILLFGQAYRSGFGGAFDFCCLNTSTPSQRVASLSWLQRVIEPLECHGARVEVLFTFPRCAHSTNGRLLRAQMSGWFAPRVVAHRLVSSTGLVDGWLKAHQLLRDYLARRGSPYDFVLHGRHDLRIGRSIRLWSPQPGWNSWLFEQICHDDCTRTCNCNAEKVPEGGCTSKNGTITHQVRLCSADGLMWIPGHSLQSMHQVMKVWGRDIRAEAHSFIQHTFKVLGWSQRTPRQYIGSLFPQTGDAFPAACERPPTSRLLVEPDDEKLRRKYEDADGLADSGGCFRHDDYWPPRGTDAEVKQRLLLLECDDDWAAEAKMAMMTGRVAFSYAELHKLKQALARRRIKCPNASNKPRVRSLGEREKRTQSAQLAAQARHEARIAQIIG